MIINNRINGQHPDYHHYDVRFVTYILSAILSSNISFRGLSKVLSVENSYYKDYPKTPCHTTLSNWVYKVGYYELTCRKKKNDWVIILDHSIQTGAAKILVIYGIPLEQIDFTRPLIYSDLTPLCIKVQDKWNWKDVSIEIEKLKKEIGTIVYAVADHEGLLRKALSDMSIPHIHDLSHKIALLLEKRYKEDTMYLNFTKALSQMRLKYVQTKLAHLIPLAARKKSIFQNIGKITQWAHKSLSILKSDISTEEEKAALSFLKEYQPLIDELYRLNGIICAMENILKTKGLSRSTIQMCNSLVRKKSKRVSVQTLDILSQLQLYLKNSLVLVKGKETLLCTSDIIESAFGKYKNFSSENKMACVTKMVLVLSAITVSPWPDKVKDILEKVKMEDIDRWTKDNIGQTSLKRRIELFSNKKIA